MSLPPPRRSKAAVLALVCALLPFVAWGSCATGVLDPDDAGAAAWLVSIALAAVGAITGFVVFLRLGSRKDEQRPLGRGMSLAAAILGFVSPVVTFFLGIATESIGSGFTRGRRLVRDGISRTAGLVDHSGWVEGGVPLVVPPALVDDVASAWRTNAATEHASVASFASLSLQLVALGAPAELVRAAHEDALDEIRHARLCYGLAARVDGRDLGAGPMPFAATAPDEAPTLASLAADAVVEACLLEGASARTLAALARGRDVDASVVFALRALAKDEGRHAAHGWDLIAWARAKGGDDVMQAVRARVASLPPRPPPEPRHGADGSLERFGIAGDALWLRCYAAALADVRARVHLDDAPELRAHAAR